MLLKSLNKKTVDKPFLPIKILQFGEGNFMRAFVDWQIHKANEAGIMNHGVAVVQPIENGMTDVLRGQDCLYHVVLEGIKEKQAVREITLVKSIVEAVNPYSDYESYRQLFLSSDLEMIISNTTEAGIRYEEGDPLDAYPPKTYPAKITALLYERFKYYKGDTNRGLFIVCCELIEDNGSTLKDYVLRHTRYNHLGDDFERWLTTCCKFYDTLVDRIVPGFPRERINEIKTELGFDDNLVVMGEYYHVWAIGGDPIIRKYLPLDRAGLNVLFMNDIRSFRERKVRILNGMHTAMVPLGLMSGCQTVRDAFENPRIEHFIKQMVETEIIPAIEDNQEELRIFANTILERFYNPYIRHYLKDIALNSLSKWETRNFPTLRDNVVKLHRPAPLTTFSFAALLTLYSGQTNVDFIPNDNPEHIDFIQRTFRKDNIENWIAGILANKSIWKVDFSVIPEFSKNVSSVVEKLLKNE